MQNLFKTGLFKILLGAALMGGGIWGYSQYNAHICAVPADVTARAEYQIEIRTVLNEQQAAWNAGDIEGFMESYWQSPNLRFASGGSVERGWQPTYERYLSRYPDKQAMGELVFSNLEIEVLDNRNALVFGHWQLNRDKDQPKGLFTLHFTNKNGRWVIISDHTSSAG